MKGYDLDLRKRIVDFVREGGTCAEAARIFKVHRHSVYRYIKAAAAGTLKPKTSWGRWRKLDPQKLRAFVQEHPDLTLKELQAVFAVSHNALWVRLRQLGLTLKKTHKISRARRAVSVAFHARD